MPSPIDNPHASDGTAQAVPPVDPTPTPTPIRRAHYLSRYGSAATLMTVETLTEPDGTERRRFRFCFYP